MNNELLVLKASIPLFQEMLAVAKKRRAGQRWVFVVSSLEIIHSLIMKCCWWYTLNFSSVVYVNCTGAGSRDL
jgi:hypothetical protein